MAYKLVIFDFDGTLADTFPWFLSIMNIVADRYGFRRVEEHEIDRLRSTDAQQIIRQLGIPKWKLPLIARHMRMLATQNIDGVRLFDGVDQMLRRLSEAGVSVAIVSSNSEQNVRRALGPEMAALISQFSCGASMFGKAPRFRRVVRESQLERRDVLCVGDEIRDHDAARRAGLAFGAVAWGFTKADTLNALMPDEMFSTPEEIVTRLAPPPHR